MIETETPPQVLIVDDDASVRTSLRRLLQASGYQVRTAASPEHIDCAIKGDAPRCLILDLKMPGISGVEFQQSLVASGNDVPIVFLTGHGDIPTTVRAMQNGAVDFLTKPVLEADLLNAVDRALRRDAAARVHRRERAALRARYDTLTPREQEVMAEVTAGRLNKQAAAEMGIAEKTVKVHRARVMEKMGAESLAELVRFSEALGLGAKAFVGDNGIERV